MYGPNTFIDENNSPEWKSSSSKYSNFPQWTRVSKRWFDFDKNKVRLSFMFDGASEIADDWGGAVIEDFTTSTQWEKYRSELRRIIRESIAQCRPITLFFNSGLHDIYSGRNLTGDDSLYVRNLERSVMNLKTMVYEEKSRRLNNVSCPDAVIETHFFWICGVRIVRYLNQEAAAVEIWLQDTGYSFIPYRYELYYVVPLYNNSVTFLQCCLHSFNRLRS